MPVWARWGVALLCLVGVWELAAHVWQVTHVPSDGDWAAARKVVEGKLKPTDLVLFAPGWSEPLGREHFGDRIASIERMARPDESRFLRAIEVSMRGATRGEIAGWPVIESERIGPFTVRIAENPHPVPVKDDLVTRVQPERMTLARVDGEAVSECAWTRSQVQSGGLGAGPAVPEYRFMCPSGGFAGVTVMSPSDYSARRCIYVPPAGGATVMRLTFRDVAFGKILTGHHTIYVEADYAGNHGTPVVLAFSSRGQSLGKFTRRDGQGWTPFETDTRDLDGQTADLVAEVSSGSAHRRVYCFEASTR